MFNHLMVTPSFERLMEDIFDNMITVNDDNLWKVKKKYEKYEPITSFVDKGDHWEVEIKGVVSNKDNKIKVEITDEKDVKISGTYTEKGDGYRSEGSFVHVFTLPENSLSDTLEATRKNGDLVLSVKKKDIPKKAKEYEKSNVRSIEVK